MAISRAGESPVPAPAPREPSASPEVALAKQMKEPLLRFTQELKNLSPLSARSDPTLSAMSELIKTLHELAVQAAKVK